MEQKYVSAAIIEVDEQENSSPLHINSKQGRNALYSKFLDED